MGAALGIVNRVQDMEYKRITLGSTEEPVKPGGIVVVVAEFSDGGLAISEETSTSSQQVRCSLEKMMGVLHVNAIEELIDELKKRFGSLCGYDNARAFMEENDIEYDWWGGSN